MYRAWLANFMARWARFPMTDLQTITDGRGRLVVIEKLDFPIKRVYFLRDVVAKRGGHAHRTLRRLMVPVMGSFNLTMRNKSGYTDFKMYDPTRGQIIEPLTWCELDEFSENAVCLVLASAEHDEADVIRDFAEFKRLISK
jgi:hypothetical protein